MLIPSTITARRTRRYTSTWYIHPTTHKHDFEPMDGRGRYIFQPPQCQAVNPSRWSTLAPPFTVHEYERLHTRDGVSSTKRISEDEGKTEKRWQERFNFIRSNLLTKQKYWEPEQEIRLYCTTTFTPHGFHTNPGVRTIQYPITALKGIIFGSRTPDADMDAIREIMIAKHSASPLPDGFEFYKAESRPDGSIQKRFITPYWREEYQYPLKVREGI